MLTQAYIETPMTVCQKVAEKCPSIFVDDDFDMPLFIQKVLSSLSLSLMEKHRVITSIPNLSSFQMEELVNVFDDEQSEFEKLIESEGEIITGLIGKSIIESMALLAYLGFIDNKTQQQQITNDIIESYEQRQSSIYEMAMINDTLEYPNTPNVYWLYLIKQYKLYQNQLTGNDFDKMLDEAF